ncbi:class I SAM-dependent methyltransferase [Mucilaginibacter agri]|uniref:Methyltransferase domain-containing protein n=1 Tax=Mucilaginibacter agri TaxID=2695265 RepID=A0A966DS03_9SPHI|nr:class I SAM-dependent methyltransferase [Mucilaginibacter agri]NCD69055.1 methyltransferase domain-containing protein [Mucilaginibacter agri]
MIAQLKGYLNHFRFTKPVPDTPSETAYDLWAAEYDRQPDNLMLALDEQIFGSLLKTIDLKDKIVADMGCGTGRHWSKLFKGQPARLTGYDVSGGMLDELKRKYPQADIVKLTGDLVPQLNDNSLDIIVSTLTVAHIDNIDDVVNAWVKALKPEAAVIITDFHPEALAMGGKRTFSVQNQKITIHNNVHPVSMLINKLAAHGFGITALEERLVDESVKHYYEKKNALGVYEKFKGRPIIYGMCLSRTKNDTPQPALN